MKTSNSTWYVHRAAPALVEIERTTVRWLADMMGYPLHTEGLLTTGFKCKWHELEPNPKNPAKLHKKPGGEKLDEVTISHDNKPAPGV